MTSARSPEQRARLSRESGLDLNRFDSVRHLGGSLGTRPNARLYEYVILSELTAVSQFTNLPIYQFFYFLWLGSYALDRRAIAFRSVPLAAAHPVTSHAHP